jgi:predicted nucleic acid-binding Zn ribbon protein
MRKKSSPQIGNVVKGIIKKIEEDRGTGKSAILQRWTEIVGEKAGAHCRPASLRKARLTVTVDSSAWLYELNTKKREYLRKIERLFTEETVKEIVFRIGKTD